jgi:hypothetical protein
MADLAIPEQYERGFIEIRGLEEDQVRELVSALKDEPPMIGRADLQQRVGQKVGPDLSSNLDTIMETLISLYALRDSMGLALPDFAEVVVGMMDESYIEELDFEREEERKSFKARLVELLEVDSLDVAARAVDVLYERERTVHSLPRVFTDIRPIFGANPEASPRGALIVHTLKISYHERGRVKELFVALDAENVNELIDVLQRANSKADALKRFLDGTDLQYIDVK